MVVETPPPPTSHHPHTALADAKGSIIYCETDEAPALATFSLLPIFQKYSSLAAGIDVVPCDISLAGRVLATFPEKLKPDQRIPDNLAYLGDLCTSPDVNIIKLPNISASVSDDLHESMVSVHACMYLHVERGATLRQIPIFTLVYNQLFRVPFYSHIHCGRQIALCIFISLSIHSCVVYGQQLPQLIDCIKELRVKGFDVPLYVADPKTDEEKDIMARYAKVLGSAVNPVLRKGNSDRHVAPVVKADAQKNPSRLMKMWSKASRTHVSHMEKGDFYGSEKSVAVKDATDVAIELVKPDGTVQVLKPSTKLLAGEVIDGTFMDVEELCKFYEREMEDAEKTNILFSLHLKATMMKVSDPILFGHW